MRFFSDTIFDEYIPNTALSAAGGVFTSSKLNATLGQYDQCSFQIVADNSSLNPGPLGVTVVLQHSADGRNWLDRNSISISIPLNGAVSQVFSDSGTTPLLGFVRLSIYLATAATVHVKISATLRDGR
jgi:hypothetical protein